MTATASDIRSSRTAPASGCSCGRAREKSVRRPRARACLRSLRPRAVEAERRLPGTPGDEAEAHDQQQVAEDAAGDRRLHQVDQARLQRHDRDDELGRVAERGVEEAADRGTGA